MRNLALTLVLLACNGQSDDTDVTGDSGDSGAAEDVYPSTFDGGDFIMLKFVMKEPDTGKDFDGDGTLDNGLPNALGPIDTLLEDDFSPEGFNQRIDESLRDKLLNILLRAAHDDVPQLHLTLLAGAWYEPDSTMYVDPGSFDENGDPTEFVGEFTTQRDFRAGPANARIPVTFLEGDPPLPVPMERTEITGDVDETGGSGMIVGVIPSQELVDDVIVHLVPEDGYSGLTKEAILNFVRAAADNPNLADIDLGDGRRGISAAFDYQVFAGTWTDEPPPEE